MCPRTFCGRDTGLRALNVDKLDPVLGANNPHTRSGPGGLPPVLVLHAEVAAFQPMPAAQETDELDEDSESVESGEDRVPRKSRLVF